MTETTEAQRHWAVDRRIPITLILAMAVQTFGFGWYMSNLSTQSIANRSEIAKHADRIDTLDLANVKQEIALAVVQERVLEIKTIVNRIDRKLNEGN